MESLFQWKSLQPLLLQALTWVKETILVSSNLAQLFLVMATFLIARYTAPRILGWIEKVGLGRRFEKQVGLGKKALAPVMVTLIWLLLQVPAIAAAIQAGWPYHLNEIVLSLLTAWTVIRLTSPLIRDPAWARFIAYTAWVVAALNILNLLDPTIKLLDSLALSFGASRISLLAIIKGFLIFTALLWLANFIGRELERRIRTLPALTPSIKVLFSKLLNIILITIAMVVALNTVGIDLTAFAVFTGAVGVGVGFGLQKVVSNLICGVILLLDKSVKPGDVISVGDTFGTINSLGARFVSVVATDGKEYLIPNEDLIARQVVNWSHSNNKVSLNVPIGISYSSDVPLAMKLCLEAAGELPRVLAQPETLCHLIGFGDSSVDLALVFWINDPGKGILGVRSDVLLHIWDKFHQHGIEIPFPQRDVHLKSAPHLKVSFGEEEPAESTPEI